LLIISEIDVLPWIAATYNGRGTAAFFAQGQIMVTTLVLLGILLLVTFILTFDVFLLNVAVRALSRPPFRQRSLFDD
jgi:hypothetical protein